MLDEVEAIGLIDATLAEFDERTRMRVLTYVWDKRIEQPKRDRTRLAQELPRVGTRMRKLRRDLCSGRIVVEPCPPAALGETGPTTKETE